MEKQLEEKNTEMGNVITRSEEFIQKNQKTLTIVLVAILVLIALIFGLRKWVFQPRENRAAEEMFAAEQWFNQGDFEKALNGDDTYRGFVSVAEKYSSTKAGKLARTRQCQRGGKPLPQSRRYQCQLCHLAIRTLQSRHGLPHA